MPYVHAACFSRIVLAEVRGNVAKVRGNFSGMIAKGSGS
jgi:hypothetical protein